MHGSGECQVASASMQAGRNTAIGGGAVTKQPVVQGLGARRVQGVLAADLTQLAPSPVDLHEDVSRGQREEATPDDAPRHLRCPMRAQAVEVPVTREPHGDDALAVRGELDVLHPFPDLRLRRLSLEFGAHHRCASRRVGVPLRVLGRVDPAVQHLIRDLLPLREHALEVGHREFRGDPVLVPQPEPVHGVLVRLDLFAADGEKHVWDFAAVLLNAHHFQIDGGRQHAKLCVDTVNE
mmetsp:Transcript_46134/g.129845  ORF Transcript_46134/g.129845 Transcript_46134/m.129845 type:complete len:237 (+) Transcript_46134:376-1086(+)